MKIIDEVYMIANNALYFDDSSDYSSALLEAIHPDLFEDECVLPDLDYIEKEIE